MSTDKSVSKSKRAATDLFEGLEDIRTKIVLTLQELSVIERAPVSMSIATDRVDIWLASLRNEDALKLFVQRFMFPAYRAPTPTDALEFMMGILSQMARGETLKLLTSNYGETLKGLSDADRKTRFDKTAADLLALELSEEAIIRNAEQLGLDVLRRPDADPRAVLATAEELA